MPFYSFVRLIKHTKTYIMQTPLGIHTYKQLSTRVQKNFRFWNQLCNIVLIEKYYILLKRKSLVQLTYDPRVEEFKEHHQSYFVVEESCEMINALFHVSSSFFWTHVHGIWNSTTLSDRLRWCVVRVFASGNPTLLKNTLLVHTIGKIFEHIFEERYR